MIDSSRGDVLPIITDYIMFNRVFDGENIRFLRDNKTKLEYWCSHDARLSVRYNTTQASTSASVVVQYLAAGNNDLKFIKVEDIWNPAVFSKPNSNFIRFQMWAMGGFKENHPIAKRMKLGEKGLYDPISVVDSKTLFQKMFQLVKRYEKGIDNRTPFSTAVRETIAVYTKGKEITSLESGFITEMGNVAEFCDTQKFSQGKCQVLARKACIEYKKELGIK